MDNQWTVNTESDSEILDGEYSCLRCDGQRFLVLVGSVANKKTLADSLNRLDEIEEALADLEDSRRLLPRVVFSPTVDGPSNLDDLERACTRYKRVKRLSIEAAERRANR